MFVTPWGYLETYAILHRKFHSKVFTLKSLSDAVTSLQREVIDSSGFELISVSDSTTFSAAALIDAHNMNSADAAILAACLEFQSQLSRQPVICLLVASDKRLLRAANAEGSRTIDPENILPKDVPALLLPS